MQRRLKRRYAAERRFRLMGLGAILLSTINIAYYQTLMQGMRDAIERGQFADFKAKTKEQWARGLP